MLVGQIWRFVRQLIKIWELSSLCQTLVSVDIVRVVPFAVIRVEL